jgi:hypothetical protein
MTENPPKRELTTRLQKGGALLSDMRLLVTAWSEEMVGQDPLPLLTRALPKATTARARDTFARAFRPRFINGSPPNAWRLVKVLEDLKVDTQFIRPFYYWITARSESALYGFVTEVLYARSRSQDREIRVEEAAAWFTRELQKIGKKWTPLVTLKVARGMLAALRDFEILEGVVRKRLTWPNLPPATGALIAFILQQEGTTGKGLVRHLDWRLFLMGETAVEHLFLECHQHGWFKFESLGNLCRTEFPENSFEEYAHVVFG